MQGSNQSALDPWQAGPTVPFRGVLLLYYVHSAAAPGHLAIRAPAETKAMLLRQQS